MKFEIKHRWSGSVLFKCEALSLKIAVEAAVSKGAYLEGADLEGADLKGAYLEGADLEGADLKGADLKGAYLEGAYLKGADLKGADLKGAYLEGAYLEGAYLKGAYLEGADLKGADLKGAYLKGAYLKGAYLDDIKKDFFAVLEVAKSEVLGLYDALMRGKVAGSVYEGECACLVGTIANLRKEKYESLSIDLKPQSQRPAEKWFLAIDQGDIPQSNQVSAITAGWCREWMDANGVKYPKYEITAINS